MVEEHTSPSMVWFEDKPSGSWQACNIPIKSHQNERDSEVVQLLDYATDDDLKELIGTTYTNKMHLLFGSPSLKNSKVKHA